jgi:hypothetical protein
MNSINFTKVMALKVHELMNQPKRRQFKPLISPNYGMYLSPQVSLGSYVDHSKNETQFDNFHPRRSSIFLKLDKVELIQTPLIDRRLHIIGFRHSVTLFFCI